MVPDIAQGGAPLFRRIADALADAIRRGDYPVGGRLPPEFTMMRMFGASRFTIREALGELRSRGLINSRRGSGSVVLRTTSLAPMFGESYRSIDAFLAGVLEAPLEALSISNIVADAKMAERMRCDEGRQFLLFHGTRRRRGRPEEPPLALTDAAISATYGAIRPYLASLSESIASTAEKWLGVRLQRIVQELEPALLVAEEGERLAAPVGSAAMLVRRWYYVDRGDLLLVSRSIYPKGRSVYRTELRRGEPPRAGEAPEVQAAET